MKPKRAPYENKIFFTVLLKPKLKVLDFLHNDKHKRFFLYAHFYSKYKNVMKVTQNVWTFGVFYWFAKLFLLLVVATMRLWWADWPTCRLCNSFGPVVWLVFGFNCDPGWTWAEHIRWLGAGHATLALLYHEINKYNLVERPN